MPCSYCGRLIRVGARRPRRQYLSMLEEQIWLIQWVYWAVFSAGLPECKTDVVVCGSCHDAIENEVEQS